MSKQPDPAAGGALSATEDAVGAARGVAVRQHVGVIVAGRYRLERLIGQGGMGSVWEATHLVTRKHVALKFLRNGGPPGSIAHRRLLREARAVGAIRHPNVVPVHDTLETAEGEPVLVMDLLVGESLGKRLAAGGPLPLAEAATILGPVASAVTAAHAAGIVHRDLKPDNLFLVALPDGGSEVRVLDFGFAKLTAFAGDAATSGTLTASGDMLGTPYYMAPEQAFGEPDVDQRADVWALGAILYECLTGRRPFQADNFGQIIKRITTGDLVPLATAKPELPADVTDLVDRMLSVERARRPQNLQEVIEILRRHVDGGIPGEAPPIPRGGGAIRRLALWGGALLLLGSGAGAWLGFTRRSIPLVSPETSAPVPAGMPDPRLETRSSADAAAPSPPGAGSATIAPPRPSPPPSTAPARPTRHRPANPSPSKAAFPAAPSPPRERVETPAVDVVKEIPF